MTSQYTKPSLSCIEQLALLKQRGLIIDDDKKALHLLEHIGYYCLCGYWYTLLATPKTDHRFKPSSTLSAAFRMYCFDRELRQIVLGEIEKIEVAVKSQIDHFFSAEFGDQWYANPALFNNKILFLRINETRACFFDEQLTACSLLDPVPNRLIVKTHFLTHLGNAFIIRG